tara:strand:- start:1832 stop:2002 length:171 start_codon:yes stop_codon:yes gene_type:complete
MSDIEERLSIVANHLKLADQAIEELDYSAARSFLFNAQSTVEQCREIAERESKTAT